MLSKETVFILYLTCNMHDSSSRLFDEILKMEVIKYLPTQFSIMLKYEN